MPKRILFLTGTRADFGKLKPLISKLQPAFEVHIFVTGMHMLRVFGSTHLEVKKAGFKNIFRFVNQRIGDQQDQILAKTISGFSDFIRETPPDLIFVHGDRVEALAGALVGATNNIRVAHDVERYPEQLMNQFDTLSANSLIYTSCRMKTQSNAFYPSGRIRRRYLSSGLRIMKYYLPLISLN